MTDQCGACNQCLHDRLEEEGLQYLHCRAEQWDWEVTISDPVLVAFLPSKSGLWRSSSKLPGYQLRQLRGWRAPSEDQAVLTQMVKVECSEPVRPLGGGRARLPYGRCYASLRTACMRGLHGGGGGGLSWPLWVSDRVGLSRQWTACWRLVQSPSSWSGFFPSKAIKMFGGGLDLLPPGLCRRAARENGDAVGGLQEGDPLVLRFLANEPLDVPVHQLDSRVEKVIGAALISLRDEGSHNIWERAAVIRHITTGDVVSSGVAEDIPEDLFPSRAGGWQRCFSESPLWLWCESLPVSIAEVCVGTSIAEVCVGTSFPRWGRGMTREGDCYGEMVRSKGGKGGPCHIEKEIPAQKGDVWRGGLDLGGEASRD